MTLASLWLVSSGMLDTQLSPSDSYISRVTVSSSVPQNTVIPETGTGSGEARACVSQRISRLVMLSLTVWYADHAAWS